MSKITDFFAKTKKSAILSENNRIQSESSIVNLTDQFYKGCLLSKYSKCENENCSKLKKELEQQISEMRLKCDNTQRAVAIVSSIFTEKEEKIKILQAKVNVFPSEGIYSEIN